MKNNISVKPTQDKKKITIIGGGLSGLTSAAYLSDQGHHVTLIEKNKQLGGRANLLRTKNGFVFDMGPSWYMMPEVIEDIFNELGYSSADFFKLTELQTKYRLFKDNQQPIDLNSDLATDLKLFEKINKDDIPGIKKLLKITKSSYELSTQRFLQRAYQSPLDLISAENIYHGLKLLSNFNPFQSYHSLIKKYIKNKTLQQIFEFHTVFLGGNPNTTPAIYSILIAADFYKKIWYPMGGMYQLVNALESVCLKNAVEIIKGESVDKINIKDSKVDFVCYGKKKLETDLLISSADYAHTQLDLIDNKRREYSKQYWDKKDYSISSILIYLGLNKKMKNLSHHNFYFQDDWNKHFETIEKTSQFPKNPNFYLSAASKTDPTVAPKGNENIFILVPVSVRTTEKEMDKYIDYLFTHIENKIGEKFQNNIIYKKVYTQSDFTKDFNAHKGNALGLAHTLGQSVFLRPQMRSKKIKNMYYVGQFTQPGVGVPTTMLSGKYIKQIIKKDLDGK